MSDATIVELVLGAALAVASFLLFSILKRLLLDEVVGWLPIFTAGIARAASAFVPLEHRERYREEWLAELKELGDRKVYGLLWALRVLFRSWATRPGRTPARKTEVSSTPPSPPDPLPPPRFVAATDSARVTESARVFISFVVERTRPPYWDDIRAEMGEPGQHDLAGELEDATQRFERLLGEDGDPVL